MSQRHPRHRRHRSLLATGTAVVAIAAATLLAGPAASAPAATTVGSTPVSTGDMTNDVIYQLLTDRFVDGSTANDDPSGSTGLSDTSHTNWQLYWGGDFAGVTSRMQYLADLGVGAIWISPPVQNVNKSVGTGSAASAGYHGYWGMDFYVPEPHFGSWADFDAMVSAAHAKGIKVVMDWAPNHSSPEDVNNASYGVDGVLKKNGVVQSEYDNDPGGFFHHNGGVSELTRTSTRRSTRTSSTSPTSRRRTRPSRRTCRGRSTPGSATAWTASGWTRSSTCPAAGSRATSTTSHNSAQPLHLRRVGRPVQSPRCGRTR